MNKKHFFAVLIFAALFYANAFGNRFNPTDIDGCSLWLDGSDDSSFVISADRRITKWLDKSGNNADFAGNNRNLLPLKAKQAVEFRGGQVLVSELEDYFKFLHNGQAVSLFAVFETLQEHPRKFLAVLGSGGNNEKSAGFVLAFNDSNVFHENNALAIQVSNGDDFVINSRRIREEENYALYTKRQNVVSYTFDNDKKTANAYVFGRKVVDFKDFNIEDFSNSAAIKRFCIGAAEEDGSFGFIGRISEVIIYNRLLGEDDRLKIESYLNDKYSIKPYPKVVLDNRCLPAKLTKKPCAIENDGKILAIEDGKLFESEDGVNWSVRSEVLHDVEMPDLNAGSIMAVSEKGTLVSFFVNRKDAVKLNYENGKFNSSEASFPIYTIRSVDGGKTWTDCRLIQPGYCGAIRGLIVTSKGNIVLSAQNWDPENERHITTVYTSTDDGVSFHYSKVDNGIGRGMHDGFFESTIAELSDGSILMLGRTCLGQFWQSVSADGGFSWSKPRPSGISSSGYPGFLLKLKSGNLALVWNRFYPEGGEGDETLVGMASKSWFWGEERVSRFSRELSLMFSKDDGKSWSKPIIIAEGLQDNVRLAYPKMMEIGEGNIYIWAGMLTTRINENDFN